MLINYIKFMCCVPNEINQKILVRLGIDSVKTSGALITLLLVWFYTLHFSYHFLSLRIFSAKIFHLDQTNG